MWCFPVGFCCPFFFRESQFFVFCCIFFCLFAKRISSHAFHCRDKPHRSSGFIIMTAVVLWCTINRTPVQISPCTCVCCPNLHRGKHIYCVSMQNSMKWTGEGRAEPNSRYKKFETCRATLSCWAFRIVRRNCDPECACDLSSVLGRSFIDICWNVHTHRRNNFVPNRCVKT